MARATRVGWSQAGDREPREAARVDERDRRAELRRRSPGDVQMRSQEVLGRGMVGERRDAVGGREVREAAVGAEERPRPAEDDALGLEVARWRDAVEGVED